MARPLYETAESLSEERALIDRVCAAWKCEAVKLPIEMRVDFALCRANKVVSWAEVRQRRRRFDPYYINLQKWVAAAELAEVTGKPAFFVVCWPDWFGYVHADASLVKGDLLITGRRDRDDWQDIAPAVSVPLSLFRELRA
jgi:hypothetical protein